MKVYEVFMIIFLFFVAIYTAYSVVGNETTDSYAVQMLGHFYESATK